MNASVSTHDPRKTTKATLRLALLLSGVLTLVFLVSYVFSKEGVSELQMARGRVNSLRAEITALERERAGLRAEIGNLKRSSFTVERIAREDLGMSRPGEIVYMVPPSRKTQ